MLKRKNIFKNQITKLTILVASLLILMPLNIFALLTPTTDFYVNDYANVLDEGAESFIMSKSASLDQMTGAQVVVLTVDNMDGKDSNSFAIEVAREWGIGDKDKDNGVLILLAIEEREIRVEVGRGLEGALNDGKVGRIIDEEAGTYLGKDDFSEGILALYKGLLREIMVEYNIETIDDYKPEYVDYNKGTSMFEIILLIIVIVAITSIPKGPRGRRSYRTYRPPTIFGGGFSGGNFKGGGGFTGGGFSGGGGGFSGGGAGRKF